MGAGENDIIQVVDVQTYHNQTCLNVFYYQVLEGYISQNATYTDFMNQFVTVVVDKIRALQVTTLTHTRIDIRNLVNGIEFETMVLSGKAGTVAGEGLPPFCCYSFRLNRSSRVTRHGYKRFAGVPESKNNDGEPVSLDQPGNDAATALGASLMKNAIPIARPVIMHRPIPVPLQSPGYLYATISSVNLPKIGSQNTRKIGRGT